MCVDIDNPHDLTDYLIEHRLLMPDETPAIVPLTGGVANKTIFVLRQSGEDIVVKQALERFRVKADWTAERERSHREVLGLQAFGALCPPGSVPRFLYEDEPCFIHAMTAIPQPHQNYKQLLLEGRGTPELASNFAHLLAHVHLAAAQRADEFAPAFSDLRFFESQRLQPFYAYAGQQEPAAAAFMEALIVQTRRIGVTLVHGDYSPKNVLVRPENQLVLLDFEIAHWGDPAFDAGLALTHLVAKAVAVKTVRGQYLYNAQQFLATYLQQAGDAFDGVARRIASHFLACSLARVRGKGVLEYFREDERHIIAGVVLSLIAENPQDPAEALSAVVTGCERSGL
jgi:aminoglycoside phosphotransferase (APT) family kinase protein